MLDAPERSGDPKYLRAALRTVRVVPWTMPCVVTCSQYAYTHTHIQIAHDDYISTYVIRMWTLRTMLVPLIILFTRRGQTR